MIAPTPRRMTSALASLHAGKVLYVIVSKNDLRLGTQHSIQRRRLAADSGQASFAKFLEHAGGCIVVRFGWWSRIELDGQIRDVQVDESEQ